MIERIFTTTGSIALLVLLAYFLWHQNRRMIKENGLRGVHGWLATFCVLLFAKSIVLMYWVYNVESLFRYRQPEIANLAEFQSFAANLVNIGLLSFLMNLIAIGLIIWLRRPVTVRLVLLIIWITGPVASFGIYLTTQNSFPIGPEMKALFPYVLGLPVVFAVIFSAYFLLSKRVKNTFGITYL